MSLRINAENYTNAALRFCVYVGGVSVSSKPDQVLSLAWATSPFPAVGEGNQPGKTSVSWEQTYGFTVLSKGNAGQASWSASVENNGYMIYYISFYCTHTKTNKTKNQTNKQINNKHTNIYVFVATH